MFAYMEFFIPTRRSYQPRFGLPAALKYQREAPTGRSPYQRKKRPSGRSFSDLVHLINRFDDFCGDTADQRIRRNILIDE